jgi:hypothetical protein
VFLRIQVYWDVALCCWVSGSQHFWEHTACIFKGQLVSDCLTFADEGTPFCQNFGKHSVSYPKLLGTLQMKQM